MRALSCLLLLILGLRALPAAAQSPIHHCIDAGGHAVYTDQPCASMQATAVPTTPVRAPTAATDVDAWPAGRPAPLTCAASPAQLRQAVIDAFADRDANRMAGFMLWNGYGEASVVAGIRAIARAMQQPLLDAGPAEDDPAEGSSTGGDDGQTGSGQLVLHTTAGDGSGGTHELRYDIVHRAGCLWLRPAD